MAVNFNSPLAPYQGAGKVIKSKTEDQKLSNEQRPLATPIDKVTKTHPPQVIKSDDAALVRLDEQRKNKDFTSFDKPDRVTKQALKAYGDVANAQKRSEIASVVGVDLYV